MSTFRVLLVGVLNCLVVNSAWAAEWVRIAISENSTIETFIDVANIRDLGNSTWRVWQKNDMAPKSERGLYEDANKWVDYNLARKQIDCVNETSKTESSTTYYEDGSNSSISAEFLRQQPAVPIAPETLLEAVMLFVCKPRT